MVSAHTELDEEIIQVRTNEQRKRVQGADGYTCLLATTGSLILIVCLISIAPSTISQASTVHFLQAAPTVSSLPRRGDVAKFPTQPVSEATGNAVLAVGPVSPSGRR